MEMTKAENRLPAALMEKMHEADRSMLICSADELAPNLHGIWTGSWNAPRSGDFTFDTNIEAAMASACSTNLPDLMESLYREWRLNARRIYGRRGYFTNALASNTALALHWGNWLGVFWTAGCGWLASFFTDDAQYTDDGVFLANRCLPLLKGEIHGLLARGQITVNRLPWDTPAGTVHLTVTSGIRQTIALRLGEKLRGMN